ncbi:MAG: hypothetical protein WD401_06120 [Thermomicrobiaceae bacterium]
MDQRQNPGAGEYYRRLTSAARDDYGEQRAGELDDQLRHLSEMMAGVAGQRLTLTDAPIEQLPRQDRSGQ